MLVLSGARSCSSYGKKRSSYVASVENSWHWERRTARSQKGAPTGQGKTLWRWRMGFPKRDFPNANQVVQKRTHSKSLEHVGTNHKAKEYEQTWSILKSYIYIYRYFWHLSKPTTHALSCWIRCASYECTLHRVDEPFRFDCCEGAADPPRRQKNSTFLKSARRA